MSADIECVNLIAGYGDKPAIKQISVKFELGKVHALVGENGAGKTTLFRCLARLMAPSEGSLLLPNQELIGMLRQDGGLIEQMSLLENFAISNRNAGGWRTKLVRQQVETLFAKHGFDLPDLETTISQFSFGQKLQFGLLRLFYSGKRILLLDEPTAAMSSEQAYGYYQKLRSHVANGGTAIIASQRVDELLQYADTVHVLRAGQLVLSESNQKLTNQTVKDAIFGQMVTDYLQKTPMLVNEPALQIEDLVLAICSDKINLTVNKGEIVGIGGQAGNGQTELIETIAGVREQVEGNIKLAGESLRYIPENPIEKACLAAMTIGENLVLHCHREKQFCNNFQFIDNVAIAKHATKIIVERRLVTRDATTPFAWLSGGNQRKLLFARETDGKFGVLVAHNPTAGLDYRSITEVVNSLIQLRNQQIGVLVVTEDQEFMANVADRVYAINQGCLKQLSLN